MTRPGRVPGLLIMRGVLVAVGVGVICLSILVGLLFGRVHAQFVALNAERTHNILASCRDTNQRHDDTVAALNRTMLKRLTGQKVPLSLPDGKVRTRPLCAYPAVTTYRGIGSTDDAANFQCAVTKVVR